MPEAVNRRDGKATRSETPSCDLRQAWLPKPKTVVWSELLKLGHRPACG